MYCPKCLNNSLHINSRGVMNIIINGKQMDAGRFLYNFDKDKATFLKDLNTKLEEFFKWYSNFTNTSPITKIEICSSDVVCDNKCAIPISNKFSVIDSVISARELKGMLDKLGQKYNLEIEFTSES